MLVVLLTRLEGCTYDHVEAIAVREGGNEGCYKRMSGDCGESVALVTNVLYLLQSNDCRSQIRMCQYIWVTIYSIVGCQEEWLTVDFAKDLKREDLAFAFGSLPTKSC